MQKAVLNPTPAQTCELFGEGPFDFARILRHTQRLQREGRIEEACNERFDACRRLGDLLPEDEEVILEWSDPGARAALELLYGSAVDHFLIDDFELSAALLEQLGELDPEDHLASLPLLAFDYLALDDYDSFEAIAPDLAEHDPQTVLLRLWVSFRRTGRLDEDELRRLRERFGPVYAEFTADEHPADAQYLRDIESERPTAAAQARELWLRTENLWRRFPDWIGALRAVR